MHYIYSLLSPSFFAFVYIQKEDKGRLDDLQTRREFIRSLVDRMREMYKDYESIAK